MSLQWDRDYKERYEDGTRFFRGVLIGLPLGLASWYFLGWWVVPFFRAMWRMR